MQDTIYLSLSVSPPTSGFMAYMPSEFFHSESGYDKAAIGETTWRGHIKV